MISGGLADGCAVASCCGDGCGSWNLRPVPLERLSALAFGGMSVAMLLQYLRAESRQRNARQW